MIAMPVHGFYFFLPALAKQQTSCVCLFLSIKFKGLYWQGKQIYVYIAKAIEMNSTHYSLKCQRNRDIPNAIMDIVVSLSMPD
jgi:hypothetical protein